MEAFMLSWGMEAANQDIYAYCLDLLSRRAYSSFKLRRKLKSKKFFENEIVVVLKLLAAERFLRDDLYAESRARTWMAKGESSTQILRRLKLEGLSLSLDRITELFEESDHSPADQVKKLVETQLRKQRQIPTDSQALFKLKQKITASVMRKGHSFSAVKPEVDLQMRDLA